MDALTQAAQVPAVDVIGSNSLASTDIQSNPTVKCINTPAVDAVTEAAPKSAVDGNGSTSLASTDVQPDLKHLHLAQLLLGQQPVQQSSLNATTAQLQQPSAASSDATRLAQLLQAGMFYMPASTAANADLAGAMRLSQKVLPAANAGLADVIQLSQNALTAANAGLADAMRSSQNALPAANVGLADATRLSQNAPLENAGLADVMQPNQNAPLENPHAQGLKQSPALPQVQKCVVAKPVNDARGHTGYLTFARRSVDD